jgi:hypothetical protein
MEMGNQVAIVQQQRSVREQQLSAFVLGEGVERGKEGRGGKLGIFDGIVDRMRVMFE